MLCLTKAIIIAEPGRFLTSNIADLYVKITGKKVENGVIKYYVNNSVYGDFNCKIFDYTKLKFDILRKNCDELVYNEKDDRWNDNKSSGLVPGTNSTIFGSTCDSIDMIAENIKIPELDIGDYLKFKEMGAYTMAAASTFNGIPKPYKFYFGDSSAKVNLKRKNAP